MRLLHLVVIVALGGCTDPSLDRECSKDEDCLQDGMGGLCRISTTATGTRWCAFPSSGCESGLKWGLLSGDGLAQTCLPPADAGRGSSLASLNAAPGAVTFDPVVVGDTMSALVTVRNAGTGPSDTLSTAIHGPDAMQFRVDGDSCSGQLLDVGASCSLRVVFAPASAGDKAAAVQIGDGVAVTSVAANGTALAPGVLVFTMPPVFATVHVPGTAAASATVKNTGGSTLDGVQIAISGANAADFTLASDGCSNLPLAPGATCSLSLQFIPAAVGVENATLTVRASADIAATTSLDAGAVATLTIVLDGHGPGTVTSVPPGLTCSRSGGVCSHDFDVPSVTLTAATSLNAQFDGWDRDVCPFGASCTVTLTQATTVHAPFSMTSAWVDPVSGSDLNPGTIDKPFKTITKTMSLSGGDLINTVQLLPGIYSEATNGETFPIVIVDSVRLIGDEVNKGDGPAPVFITGDGTDDESSREAVLVAGSSVTIAGVKIQDGNLGAALKVSQSANGVGVRTNSLVDSDVGVSFPCNDGCGGRTLVGNIIRGNGRFGLSAENQELKVEGNLITNNATGVVILGVDLAPDFGGGRASSTGGNTFSCNRFADINYQVVPFAVVSAHDDFWDHSPPTKGKEGMMACPDGTDYCSNGSLGELDLLNPMLSNSPCS